MQCYANQVEELDKGSSELKPSRGSNHRQTETFIPPTQSTCSSYSHNNNINKKPSSSSSLSNSLISYLQLKSNCAVHRVRGWVIADHGERGGGAQVGTPGMTMKEEEEDGPLRRTFPSCRQSNHTMASYQLVNVDIWYVCKTSTRI
jgi:hypothetical protein